MEKGRLVWHPFFETWSTIENLVVVACLGQFMYMYKLLMSEQMDKAIIKYQKR